MIGMAAEKKKPDEASATCGRACASDKTCSPRSASEPRPDSPPGRATAAAGCRHQRKGAVREKRSASLNRPRPPSRQRADADADADTSFVTSGAAAVSSPRPFIDFASISEEELMKPVGPSARLDDGVEEFPAYVPWKAAYTWPEDVAAASAAGDARGHGAGRAVTCYVCKRCRCSACQKMCKYPKTTVCRVDVSPSNALIDALEFLPCVRKTARCVAFDGGGDGDGDGDGNGNGNGNGNGDSSSSPVKWFGGGNPFAGRRRHERPADSGWRSLLRACFPCVGTYRPLGGAGKCADNCYGNIRVAGCKCMDWDAARQGRRARGQNSAYYAALSSSTADRRRRYQDQRLADTTARAVRAAKTIAAAKAAEVAGKTAEKNADQVAADENVAGTP